MSSPDDFLDLFSVAMSLVLVMLFFARVGGWFKW